MKHRLKLSGHLNVIIVTSVIGILLFPFFLNEASVKNDPLILYLFGGATLLVILTVLYTHIEYVVKNWSLSVEVHHDSNNLYLSHKKKSEKIPFSDIVEIQHHKSVALAPNTRKILLTDTYHYSKVTLKDGRRFYITSLVCPNFTLALDDKEKLVTRVIALISFERD